MTITKSEIRRLLEKYDNEKGRKNKTDVSVIAGLRDLLSSLSDKKSSESIALQHRNSDELSQEELYRLALVLLTRAKSIRWFGNTKPTKSEVLAKTLEDKFDEGIFQALRNQFTQNNESLTREQFDSIVLNTIAANDQTNPSSAPQPGGADGLDISDNPNGAVSDIGASSDPLPRKKSPDVEDKKIDAQPIITRVQPPVPLAIAENVFSPFDGQIILKLVNLSFSSLIALSQTGKFHRGLFYVNKEISHFIEIKRDLFRQLLGHTALGELADAEEIWRAHPDLLTCYGTIFHPNRIYDGKKVVGEIPFHHNPGRYKYMGRTPLQILWMNEEYEDAKLIEELVGPSEMARQFFEVFPEGVIKKDNFELEEAERLLQAVFDAIITDGSLDATCYIDTDGNIHFSNLDQMNENTRAALDSLYRHAKPTSDHKTGLVFDANFYLAALTLYDTKAKNNFNQDWDKYNFWCIRVEEWLAGCLATGYLRPHGQGIIKNVEHRRGSHLAEGSSCFAFRRTGDQIPGLHFFIGDSGWWETEAVWHSTGRTRGVDAALAFSKLCRAKNISASDLCKRATQALKQAHGP